ncbi:hypothetical protein SLS63_001538 [Diaporthe eres]|uniref:Subtilisin n=1 Tax=Diaporthe eres TaxID=83184 RepID=A0ABR1PNJ1_DIAER
MILRTNLPDFQMRWVQLARLHNKASQQSAVLLSKLSSRLPLITSTLSVIQKDLEMIKTILGTIFGFNTRVTSPVKVWIDDNDEAFQELVCYIDDDGSRIWRAIEKHSSLHAGINALNSMNSVIHQNLIVILIEIIVKDLIQSLYDEYSAYITSTGHIIQGWTQAWRLCTTQWDIRSLENREEEPDEDDEDDWLPRYQIFTKPDSSVSSLRGLERVLDSEGWEAAYNGEVFKCYVVDLNIMQALLPKTMHFVDETFRFVWEGSGNHSTSTGSKLQTDFELESLGFEKFTSAVASGNMNAGAEPGQDGARKDQIFDPASWPAPTGSEQMPRPIGHYLKSLSQQKGEDLWSFKYYTYAEPRGEGSWIFVIDSGFDTTHEVIDDNIPDLNGRGHGTAGK